MGKGGQMDGHTVRTHANAHAASSGGRPRGLAFPHVVSALLVTVTLWVGLAARSLADTTPPVLTALSFPASVDVTDGPATVTVDYSATDDLSGVYYFGIGFQGPGLGCGGAGASAYEYVTPALSYTGSPQFTLGQYSTPIGTYPVCSLEVCDAVWNCHNYTVSDLQGLGLATQFVVTGEQDVTAPVLTGLSFPSSVDVTGGSATVTVNYGATDDLSGVQSFQIYFAVPGDGCGVGNSDYFTPVLSRSGSVSFQLGQYSTAIGAYVVCSLSVYDAAGNGHYYTVSDLQSLGLPTQFTVTGVQDVTAPVLTALSFPSSVDVTGGPATVTVSYSATDDLSGVQYFQISFAGPSGSCWEAGGSDWFSPALSRSGSVSFQLGQYSTPIGTYVVCYLAVEDAAGNWRSYTVSDLQGLGLATQFVVTGEQDVTAPVLTGLSFPSSVDVTGGSATVTVNYGATDDLSGVQSFQIYFAVPGDGCGVGNSDYFTPVLSRSGSVSFQLGQYSTAIGAYVVCSLSVYDAAGNGHYYTVSDLQSLGLPTQFTVTGVQDVTAPVLTALSFPSSVDVTGGPATVTVSYSATDDLSGVYYFAINFQGPSGGCGVGSYGYPGGGLSVSSSVSFQLGQFSTPPGTYTVCNLLVQDAVGNPRYYAVADLTALSFPTQFTVTGTQDTIPPVLTALSFPSAVDVSGGPATVTVDYSATDDLSGVYYFAINFQGPSGGCGVGSYGYPGGGLSVSSSVSFQLGQFSTPPGTYTVCNLLVQDAVGNPRYYAVADLTALSFPTQFTVTGTQDTTPPVLTGLSFPSTVDVANGPATVTVNYSATDDLSGVRSFQIYFAVPGGGCWQVGGWDGYFTPLLSRTGAVSFQLGQYSTVPGTYAVCNVALCDAVGNCHDYTNDLAGLGFPTQFTVTRAVCGNGIVEPGEQCDDGNTTNGDGCDATCHVEPCYTCSGMSSVCTPVADGTACDDGLFCDGTDTCDGAGSCSTHSGDPCAGNPPGSSLCDEIDNTCGSSACGDGIVSGNEDCDVGGTCIGGMKAGAQCTAESDCLTGANSRDPINAGVCLGGSKALTVCSSDSDCPGSVCVRCKTFGGAAIPGDSTHTCSATCSFETAVAYPLVPGVVAGADIQAGTSGAVVHGEILTIPLPLTGSETLLVGKEKDGQMPVVIKADSVQLPAIPVSTIACACVRGVAAKTCGGTLFERDGSQTTDCTDLFTAGDSVCTGGKPCTFVHGAGNTASGFVNCEAGATGIDYTFTQDSGGSSGVAGPPVTTFAGTNAPAGAAIVANTQALGIVVGACSGTDPAYGADGQFCTADDPQSSRGTPLTLPSTTGNATGAVYNANYTDGDTIGPFSMSGTPFSCSALAGGSAADTGLASAFTLLGLQTVGDVVVTELLQAEPVCPLDVDGSGVPPDVATDVVYIARYLLGLSPVPPSFRVLDPNIPSDAEMSARIAGLCPSVVDGGQRGAGAYR